MAFTTICLEKEQGVGIIRLNKPETRNALDMVMRVELRVALQELEVDQEVRVIVLTGQDPAFCAGGDLSTMVDPEPGKGYRRLRNVQQLVKLMRTMGKPIIASVNGAAFGVGWSLALASDFVIAAENAKFSQAFIKVGLIPDCGSMYLLPRVIGLAKAKELMMTGRPIDAEEALALGVLNKVVPREQLWPATMQLAVELAESPPQALTYIKSILNQTYEKDLEAILEYEALAQDICMQTADHQEGRQAFLEKRKPKFSGK
jgi:2-(1,2-epoxy-1,2-dihydrophenyl)acetyl-CoA isomerase